MTDLDASVRLRDPPPDLVRLRDVHARMHLDTFEPVACMHGRRRRCRRPGMPSECALRRRVHGAGVGRAVHTPRAMPAICTQRFLIGEGHERGQITLNVVSRIVTVRLGMVKPMPRIHALTSSSNTVLASCKSPRIKGSRSLCSYRFTRVTKHG